MKDNCIHLVQAAAKVPLNGRQLTGIEDRVRTNLRLLAARDVDAFVAMSPDQRLEAAAQLAAQQILAETSKKAQRLQLQINAADRIDSHLTDFDGSKLDALQRTLVFVADGKSNFMSAETLGQSVRTNALRQLTDTFESVNPKILGLFEDQEGVHNLTREIFGEETGSPEAKQGAKVWSDVTAALRTHFNDAGGVIGQLEDWRVPQHHSQMKVAKAGRDQWIADTLPKLNRSKYVSETGQPFTDQQMADFLSHAWETIATNGINKLEPGAQGAGMRANNGSEHRQIHYTDAQSYLDYQAKYGERDLWSVMVGHASQAAKDIAMVETFGPNPDHAFQLFRDKALKMEAKANPAKTGKAQEMANQMQGLYDFVAGHNPPVASKWLAQGFDTLRNWMIASRLGSAFITSFSDEATLYMTAHLNNLPESQVFRNELAAMNPADQAELHLARRAGLAMETLIGDLNRFGQEGLGRTFSSKLAQTVMRFSGLNAITDARRRAFGVTMMDAIGKLTRDVERLKDLQADDHRLLLSKGITDADWHVWRLAEPENWRGNDSVLTPESIMRVTDDELRQAKLIGAGETGEKVRRDALHRLLGTVLEETDMAVIQPGMKERAMMGGKLQRGTWKGELTRSFFLFKSFPLAMITRHWMRGMGLPTAGGKATYIASLVAATTALGALSLEVDQVLQGKDPRTLNPAEKGGVKNWINAMLKGGSLGIYGDFLFSQATQGGSTAGASGGALATVEGPIFGLIDEAMNLTQGNLVQLAQGKPTHAGAELVKFIKGNTPGANLWYAKAALDHLIFQQLQEYFSPGYMANVQRRAEREFGQSYWWRPGSGLSDARAPDLSKTVGR